MTSMESKGTKTKKAKMGKNKLDNQRRSQSSARISRIADRSKPSVHRGTSLFSPRNMFQNSVTSNHPSKQFSPVLKTQEEVFSIPEDFENIARKASDSGYQAGSIHSFQNVSIIPASRTTSNYFKNDISTQEPVNLAPGSPNYTNTSRKPCKLAIVPGSCESLNQRVTGPRPPFLDNDYVPENRNHIGCIPTQNRDLQTKTFSTSKNKFNNYKISVTSAEQQFTEAYAHKQVPQTNIMFDHVSNTYVSHAPHPQRDVQSYFDGEERQYEACNICAEGIGSPGVRGFIYEKKQFCKSSGSNSETNDAKMQLCEYRQHNQMDICNKSHGSTRRDVSERNRLPILCDGCALSDKKSSVYEVGESEYQNFETMSTKWTCNDEGNQIELDGHERSYREVDDRLDTNEAFYMDILDDTDNKLDGQKDKLTIMIASDDECLTIVTTEDGQKPVNSQDGQKSECSKLSKGIHMLADTDNKLDGQKDKLTFMVATNNECLTEGQKTENYYDDGQNSKSNLSKVTHNSVEYFKLYRICCAAKAASEADIKIPGIDNNGYVEEGFVDYLQQNREFDVRTLINICGIQLVSVDEDIIENLHNYIQLYCDYQAQKNGCTGDYNEVEQYYYTENTFKSYVQLYYVFSAAKLLSAEGQRIPGIDEIDFLDDDFLDYLQQSRAFSVRNCIIVCSFSIYSEFIANNISRYIQEYLRLHDEYQAKKSQIPEPITQRQPEYDHKGLSTQRQTVYGHQDSTNQGQPVCCHQENTTQRLSLHGSRATCCSLQVNMFLSCSMGLY